MVCVCFAGSSFEDRARGTRLPFVTLCIAPKLASSSRSLRRRFRTHAAFGFVTSCMISRAMLKRSADYRQAEVKLVRGADGEKGFRRLRVRASAYQKNRYQVTILFICQSELRAYVDGDVSGPIGTPAVRRKQPAIVNATRILRLRVANCSRSSAR